MHASLVEGRVCKSRGGGVRVLEKTRCCYHGDVSVELYSPDDRITTCMLNSQADNMMTPLSLQPSATSPLFRQSPFRTFRQKCQPQIHIEMFVEMFEMEIVEKRGLVADG